MSSPTTTYTDKFVDKFARTIEYRVKNVPYVQEPGGDESEILIMGSVMNRIIELRNNLRDLAETMDTERNYWVVCMNYHNGRARVLRDYDGIGHPENKKG